MHILVGLEIVSLAHFSLFFIFQCVGMSRMFMRKNKKRSGIILEIRYKL